jgi:glycosyltransferase involved in cell wall biosynthesis
MTSEAFPTQPPACRVLSIDVGGPIEDIDLAGAGALYLRLFDRDRPIGVLELTAPLPRYPARWLARDLAWLVNHQRHAQAIRDALVAPVVAADPPTVGVVIATRDRPASLTSCCAALSQLSPAPDEIIVVDNADVPSEAREIAAAAGFGYVHEPVAGHSRARNRGLAAASSDIVVFTDDDVEVAPGWVAALRLPFADPLVAGVTGLVFPQRLDTRAQQLFEKHAGFVRGFETRVFDGASLTPFIAGATGAGATLAVRADEARRVGGFREHLGGGTPTRSGEDHFLIHLLLARGLRVVYEPTAVAYHTHRATSDALIGQLEGYGTGMYSYLLATVEEDALPRVVVSGARAMARYTGGRVVRSRLRRPGAMPWPLARAELKGALAAPRAYVRSRRQPRPDPVDLARPAALSDWRQRLLSERPTELITTRELPPLSIVIPTRNRRSSVLRLVDDLQAQDYPRDRLEIIVSLDGDVDGTEQALHRARFELPPTITRLPHRGTDLDHGHGAGAVRNHGVRRAAHELLLFLDDDVRPRDRQLLRAHADAHARPGTIAVGPCPPVFDDEAPLLARLMRAWWVDQTRRLLGNEHLGFMDLTTANVSVERQRFLAAGGFGDLSRREDWELAYRLLADGATIRAASAAAVEHHVEVSIEGFLRDARREGAGDAHFVRLHPEVLGALPLQEWRELPAGRRRAAAAQIDGRSPSPGSLERLGAPALAALDAARLTDRFRAMLSRLRFLLYWRGVGDEVGSLDGWRSLWQRAAQVPTPDPAPVVDLTTFELRPPQPLQRHDLQVRVHGEVVGLAPVRWGGIPWTQRQFVDEVWTRHGWLARPHTWPHAAADAPDASAASIARAYAGQP